MKLGITGSTGFIGSYLCNELKYPQKKLIRSPAAISRDDAEVIHGNLEKKEDIAEFVQGISVLIHLGHIGHPRNSNDHIGSDIRQNLISTTCLFEEFAKANPQGHIVFASSGGNLYAPQKSSIPFKETAPVSPFSSYGILKLASENYLKMFCQQYGVGGTILRISNPYGVILNPKRAHGLIGVAFATVINQQPFVLVDPPETVRDFLHLKDLSEAFEKVIQNPPRQGQCRLYNVGSGDGYTILQVLNFIESITKTTIRIHVKENKILSSPSWNVLNCDKIKKELNWSPKIPLLEGLEGLWNNKEILIHPFKGSL